MIERVYTLDVGQSQQLQQRIKQSYPNINTTIEYKPQGRIILRIYTTNTQELMNIGEIIGRYIAEQSFTF